MSMPINHLSRRTVLKGGVTAALGLTAGGLLAACGSSGSGGGGTDKNLVIGFDGGTFQDYLNEAVTKPFEQKYGATIVYDSAPEAERLAKAIATKGKRFHDVEELDTKDTDKAVASGILDQFDKKAVPNWNDIDPHFRNDYWASIITYYMGIVYRTDKIPEGINSWYDLWKPEYQGRVGLPTFDWMGFQWLLIVNQIEGGSASDFSKGIDKIKAYYKSQKPVSVSGSDNAVQLFTSGEIWAAPFFDGRARQLIKADVPVKYVFPDEGAAALGEGLALMKNARRKMAEQYINFALEPDVQIAFSRLSNYSPTNTKALQNLPSDMENLLVPDTALKNLLQIDNATAYEHISDAQQMWNSQVVG